MSSPDCLREGRYTLNFGTLSGVNSIRTLRTVALLEATSFLALLVAVYFKYADDSPNGVHVLGPIHGALFLAYLYVAVNVGSDQKWPARTQLLVLLGAVLPFGGFVVDRWLGRETLKAG
jgi:integral membrane protein